MSANIEKETDNTGGHIKFTGSLGDIMKESVEIAHSCAKNFLYLNCVGKPESHYLDHHDIHVHIPEGAIPKVLSNIYFIRKDHQLE